MTNKQRVELNNDMANGLISDLCVDGVSKRDYPDFCDAYFSSGLRFDGAWRDLTEEELDVLTEDWGNKLCEMAQES